MASESVEFRFVGTGADALARDFRKVGDGAESAAKGAGDLKGKLAALPKTAMPDFLGTSVSPGKMQQQVTLIKRLFDQNKLTDFLGTSMPIGKIQQQMVLVRRLLNQNKITDFLDVSVNTGKATEAVSGLQAELAALPDTTTAAISVTTDTAAIRDLKARLDALKGGLTSITIGADDTPALAKLTSLQARANGLGRTVERLRVDADTTPAMAKLLALKVEADKLQSSTGSVKAGGAGGLGGLIADVTGFGAAADAASSGGNKFKLALAGINLATGVLEPVLAGVVVATGGLLAGFTAAGAGLGAFGLVAKSNYTTASTAAAAVQAAQVAYNAAIANGTSQASAYKTEQIAIAKAYAQLSPAQITLANSIGQAQNAWQSFVQANTAGVSKVMTQGFGLLPKVFASLQPFMAPTEKALSGLITQLGTGLGSSGFKSFIDALAAASGPAITGLGQAIGHIAVGLGGLIKAFLPVSQVMIGGLDKITAKFAQWGTTLTSHTGFQSLMTMFQTETPLAMGVLKNLATTLLNVGKAMTGISSFGNSKMLLQALLPLSGLLADLSKNTALDRIVLYLWAAQSAASKLSPAITAVRAGFSGILTAIPIIGNVTKAMFGLDAAMDANVVGLVVIAIAALGAAFYVAWQKSAGFRDVIKTIGSAFLGVGVIVVQAIKIIVDSFLNMVSVILNGAAAAFGWVPGLGGKLRTAATVFDNFKAGVNGDFDAVISKLQGWQQQLNASKNTSAAATASISSNISGVGVVANTSTGKVSLLNQALTRLPRNTNVNVNFVGSGTGSIAYNESIPGVTTGPSSAGILGFHAAGGLVTGGVPGKDSRLIMAMPGEVVVPTAMVQAGAVDHLRGSLPGFAGGGLVGAAGVFTAGEPYMENVEAAFGKAIEQQFAALVIAKFRKDAAAAAVASISSYRPGAGVAQWKGVVDTALRDAGAPVILDTNVLYQMQTESGGDPYAVNRTDINWQEGHPSVGLMQVIAGTFAAYAGRFRSTGPFAYGVSENPLANVYAAVKYAQAVYGPGLMSGTAGLGSGHGYDRGGWLMPGTTLAYNGTGRPEQVLPAGSGAGGGKITLEITSGGGRLEDLLVELIRKNAVTRGGGDVQVAYGRR